MSLVTTTSMGNGCDGLVKRCGGADNSLVVYTSPADFPSSALYDLRLGAVLVTTMVFDHFSGPVVGRTGNPLFHCWTPFETFMERSTLSSETKYTL